MKKSLKAVMALVTAMTMTMGAAGVTAYAEETQSAVTETAPRTETGTFKDGASYTYVISSGALVIGGEGSFTVEEYNALVEKVSPTVVIFGKDVIMPKNKKAANEWICGMLDLSSDYTVLSYKDSDFRKKYDEMINALVAKSVQEGKKIDRANFVEAFYVYDIDDKIEKCEDAIEKFDFSPEVAAKGQEVVDYLAEKGIDESKAKKTAVFYLYGLKERIEDYYAYPDGRENTESEYKKYLKICLNGTKTERDVISDTGEEGLNFNNVVSQFLTENGIVGNQNYRMSRQYAFGFRLSLAFGWTPPANGRTGDLAIAYRNEVESVYIAPDLTDIDMVLEYREKWVREAFFPFSEDYYGSGRMNYYKEIYDETVGYYLEGLKKRIEEGIAKETGEEPNERTRDVMKSLISDYYRKKCELRTAEENDGEMLDDSTMSEYMKKYNEADIEITKGILCSDYSEMTEDSKGKYLNAYGKYIKYQELTGNEGTLPSGLEFHYYPSTGGLLVDGDKEFNYDDIMFLKHYFTDAKFFIMGKDVKYDKTATLLGVNANIILSELTYGHLKSKGFDSIPNAWIAEQCNKIVGKMIYTFSGSDTEKDYNKYKGNDIDTSKFAILSDDANIEELLTGVKKVVPEGAKATLKGDADLSGEVSLSDIIVVAKYSMSHASYPIDSDEAKANADMNSDRVIDNLDTSALIEINLGKKDK